MRYDASGGLIRWSMTRQKASGGWLGPSWPDFDQLVRMAVVVDRVEGVAEVVG
jgi:hypothetical protein